MKMIPGLDHIIDGLVAGTRWLLRFGRSKRILIVGQGRAGKTSLFDYMRRRVIHECKEDIPMTRTQTPERMFPYKESTSHGKIDVEVRLARDLSGQTYAEEQAKWFISDKPHIVFIFIRFDNPISEGTNDVNNVRSWLEEFFGDIKEHPRALRQLVRISFVVSRKDQPPSDIQGDDGKIEKRMDDFRKVVEDAYKSLPSRARRSVGYSVYFLQMCCSGQKDRVSVKSDIDKVLVESFVNL